MAMARGFLALGMVLSLAAGSLAAADSVAPPRGMPFALDDKTTGRHFEVSDDRKSVIASLAGKQLWAVQMLTNDTEYKVKSADGSVTSTKTNLIIGISFSPDTKFLFVAIPGDGRSCFETLEVETGADAHQGGCD